MHWLFGDQLGPHFLTPGEEGPGPETPLLMIEARSVFRRRRFHRAKAHLVLSAMRHRAAEPGDRVTYVAPTPTVRDWPGPRAGARSASTTPPRTRLCAWCAPCPR